MQIAGQNSLFFSELREQLISLDTTQSETWLTAFQSVF